MDNTPGKNLTQETESAERFESDTQKLVHLHLQDKNHVITEEEIRSVRVGMMPPLDEAEAPELRTDIEEESKSSDDDDSADKTLTALSNIEP